MSTQPTFEVPGCDEAVAKHRRILAERVITAFGRPLPELRMLIYLDESDCQNLRVDYGAANRGLHFPVKKSTVRQIRVPIPMYLLLNEQFADGTVTFAYDNAIYIYDSTCSDDVALTMSCAHEFQHFMQYGFKRQAWAANMLVLNLSMQTFRTLSFTWADIATEHEARIVSKRIAERICGEERVREYIDLRRRQSANAADADDWEFVQSIDARREFNLDRETQRMYRRLGAHRQELTDRLLEVVDDPDFANINLLELFQETAAAVNSAFTGDVAKANSTAILKQHGFEEDHIRSL